MIKERERHILIHPKRGKNEKKVPENGIILVNPSEAGAVIGRLQKNGGSSRYLFNSALALDKGKRFFAAGPAIGAPMAVLTLEKLLALGAKKTILFGWCGAVSNKLHIGDIIIPSVALAGEGTSRYYSDNRFSAPESELRDDVTALFHADDIEVSGGCVWSTDAIYREDKRYLQGLALEDNVVAVDMEFSALCAVASFRRAAFCGVLVVSDELYHSSWKPGFGKEIFTRSKKKAVNILLENIGTL